MKVLKDYGAVADHGSKVLKLQKIKDTGLALVSYKDGMSVAVHGITKEEATELKRLLEECLDYKTSAPEEDNSIIHTLTTLPAGDVNYSSALKEATKEQLEEAIKIMQNNGGKNQTRIKTCKAQLDKGDKPVKKVNAKTATTEKATIDNKVIAFPKPKPEIIQLKTNGSANYEQCRIKFEEERKMFTDPDSQYVIDGLLELCKVDKDFRNNVMRKEKTYGGFMQYMEKAAQNGYCIEYGNVGWIDRDTGLGLAIDYYNHDEEKQKKLDEQKKKEAEEKAKATAKKGGKANGKNVRKKKRGAAG